MTEISDSETEEEVRMATAEQPEPTEGDLDATMTPNQDQQATMAAMGTMQAETAVKFFENVKEMNGTEKDAQVVEHIANVYRRGVFGSEDDFHDGMIRLINAAHEIALGVKDQAYQQLMDEGEDTFERVMSDGLKRIAEGDMTLYHLGLLYALLTTMPSTPPEFDLGVLIKDITAHLHKEGMERYVQNSTGFLANLAHSWTTLKGSQEEAMLFQFRQEEHAATLRQELKASLEAATAARQSLPQSTPLGRGQPPTIPPPPSNTTPQRPGARDTVQQKRLFGNNIRKGFVPTLTENLQTMNHANTVARQAWKGDKSTMLDSSDNFATAMSKLSASMNVSMNNSSILGGGGGSQPARALGGQSGAGVGAALASSTQMNVLSPPKTKVKQSEVEKSGIMLKKHELSQSKKHGLDVLSASHMIMNRA